MATPMIYSDIESSQSFVLYEDATESPIDNELYQSVVFYKSIFGFTMSSFCVLANLVLIITILSQPKLRSWLLFLVVFQARDHFRCTQFNRNFDKSND